MKPRRYVIPLLIVSTLISAIGATSSARGTPSTAGVLAASSGIHALASTPTFLLKWGSPGIGNGQFNGGPTGIAVDASGNVYVADYGYPRIQKFTSTGVFLTKWDGPASFWLTLDGASNVYVSDDAPGDNSDDIQKFTNTGTPLTYWGSYGTADGQFIELQGLAVDSGGKVYVADNYNNRIQVFTSNGVFVRKWSAPRPVGIAVDGTGAVYVTEAPDGDRRVEKFTNTGTPLTAWGSPGSGDGQFSLPFGIAVDATGSVYVADYGNHRIQKFTSGGTFLTKWGSQGSGDGQFNGPTGIAVDASGNIYVSDTSNHRIQKFAPT